MIEQENKRKKQEITNVLNQADRYYMLRRSSGKVWRKYFTSQSFKSLQNDPVFTASFLHFIENHRKMRSKVYNEVFLPTLKEWSILWVGSELDGQFTRLAQPMKSNSRLNLKMSPTRALFAFIIASAMLFFVIAQIIRIGSIKNSYINKLEPAYSFYTEDSDETQYSEISESAMPLQEGQQSQTEFTETLNKVKQAIYDNKPYSEVQSECESLQIAEKNYNILLSDYQVYGKEFIETLLDAYMGTN